MAFASAEGISLPEISARSWSERMCQVQFKSPSTLTSSMLQCQSQPSDSALVCAQVAETSLCRTLAKQWEDKYESLTSMVVPRSSMQVQLLCLTATVFSPNIT